MKLDTTELRAAFDSGKDQGYEMGRDAVISFVCGHIQRRCDNELKQLHNVADYITKERACDIWQECLLIYSLAVDIDSEYQTDDTTQILWVADKLVDVAYDIYNHK